MARGAAEIEAAVRRAGLLIPGRPVLVLFSGGRDSTCLLALAVAISGPEAVSALHVNYGLREGAGLDERHCERVCEQLGVLLAVERPAGPERATNLQAWARELRYRAAGQLAGGGDIAVGHTGDDQLETILYRLISSPSRRAVLGMDARRGQLIRPLLTVTREETTRYCDQRRLRYRDDPTNVTDAYVRNRIRNELIPLLDDLHPGASRNILTLAAILREEGEVLDGAVEKAIPARTDVALTQLRQLPRGLARLAVQQLADAARGQPAAGVAARIDDVLNMEPDAILDLPGGMRAVSKHGNLHFERTPPLRR